MNSVNHDKIQKWYGYQRYYPLATDTLPFIVIEYTFPLLPLVRYLLWLTTVNRYNPRDSNGHICFTTTSRNVSINSYGVSLVTILFLDLVKIHWIQQIQWKSFRENSIKPAKHLTMWRPRTRFHFRPILLFNFCRCCHSFQKILSININEWKNAGPNELLL